MGVPFLFIILPYPITAKSELTTEGEGKRVARPEYEQWLTGILNKGSCKYTATGLYLHS